MDNQSDLYETDFARWAEEQARALRDAQSAGANLPLDWENLAEEIEGLGRSDRRELRSRIETVIEHLLKLSFSPAREPRGGWTSTIWRERDKIEDLLLESPSLRPEMARSVAELAHRVARRVAMELEQRGEVAGDVARQVEAAKLDPDQVLGGWLPPDRD